MIDTKYYNRSQIYSECHDFIFMEIYLIRQGDAFFKGKIRIHIGLFLGRKLNLELRDVQLMDIIT